MVAVVLVLFPAAAVRVDVLGVTVSPAGAVAVQVTVAEPDVP